MIAKTPLAGFSKAFWDVTTDGGSDRIRISAYNNSI